MEILICLTFASLLVLIIVIVAFKYGKPTMNNYGTVHNHYYGHDEKETPKELPDKNVMLIAQCLGEILKTANQSKDVVSTDKQKELEK